MRIISRKQIRLFKLFLVSNWLEKTLIIVFILCTSTLILIRETKLTSFQTIRRQTYWSKSLTDSFYAKVEDIPSFIDWLETDFQTSLTESQTSYFKPFGNSLLVQYRAHIPHKCNNKSVSDEEYQFSFSKECNPLPKDSLSLSVLPLPQEDLCLEANCTEFGPQQARVYNIEHKSVKYTEKNTYSAGIQTRNRTAFADDIAKLRASNWLLFPETKVVILQVHIIDPDTLLVYKYHFIFERLSPYNPGKYFQKIFTSHSGQVNWVILAIVFVYGISGILFLLKISFEMSIEIKTFVHLSCIVCSVLQIGYFGTTITKITQYNADFPSSVPFQNNGLEPKVFNFELYSAVSLTQDTILGLLIIFLPFRLFTLFSWSKYMGYFNRFASSIYRTLPTIGILAISNLILVVSWAYFPYIVLQEHFSDFESYERSLYNFLLMDLSYNIMNVDPKEYTSLKTVSSDLSVYYFLIFAMRTVLTVFTVSFLVEAYRKSASVENYQVTEQEEENLTFLDDFTKKIDKFVKENLPQLNRVSQSKNKKMLIWLDPNFRKQDIFEEIFLDVEEDDISLMLFTHHLEVIQFLKYLFQLKPNLLHKSSDTFRLVVENKEHFEPDDQRLHLTGFDLSHVEILLDWLKDIGSTVPLLLFSETKVPYERMLQMKKHYRPLYFAYNSDILRSFAMLEGLDMVKMQKFEMPEESMSNTDSDEFITDNSHDLSGNSGD